MIKSLEWTVPAALAVFSSASAWAQGYEPHPHMWNYGWGWGMMILGPVMMIAIFAGVVAVAVLIVRWLGGGATQQTPSGDRSTALDILKERFARGEIDKDEYQERRRLLSD